MTGEAFAKIGTILITLIGAIVTYVIVPYIKSKTTTEKFKSIEYWVNFAVKAAEQLFQEPGVGEKKKQYVLDFLNGKGITISEEQLNILIEAAVYEINKNK